MDFPHLLLSCESIKTLYLARFTRLSESFAFTKLNSLHLKICSFGFYKQRDFLDPFTNCFNLKTLKLSSCYFPGIKSFRISGLQLLSLSLEAVRGRDGKVDIFAPNLTYFKYYRCWGPLVLLNELNLPSLTIVDVHVNGHSRHVPGIISMFQAFHNAQFVKLRCDTAQVLSLVVSLLENQPCPFTNLKSFEFYLGYRSESPVVPFRVMRYLHGGLVSSDFMIVKP